jgi:hypothetical protein
MDPVGLGTADSAGTCRCDNGAHYVLKNGAHHPFTPHDEWFCTNLADRIGIACPPAAIIEDGVGGYMFGSRVEGGVTKDLWWEMVARGDIELSVVAPVLSRVFAFDCFVHNDDRHLNNYLVRESGNAWTMLAMDFSRAWTYHGFPPPGLPFAPTDNTRLAQADLNQVIGSFLDLTAVDEVLNRISAVGVQTIENIVGMHPHQWLPTALKGSMLQWRQSKERDDRIDGIRKGIRDGTYI